jgi:predicted amidohydrolase
MQEKQNRLYDFSQNGKLFSLAHAEQLQAEMIARNCALMEEGAKKGEFLVSSEAINFPGPPDRLSFSAWDLVSKTYTALTQKIFQFAREQKVWLAVGLYRPAPDGVMYNSVLVVNRRGELVVTYNKVHLAGSEKQFLSAGDSFCCFDSEFGKIGVCICWDMQFPETCRILSLLGARLIICPTWGWEAIYSGSRAYENGVYAAGAMAVPYDETIGGLRSPSSVIDPEGSVIAAAGADSAEILACEIDLRREWDTHAIRMGGRRPELYGGLIR